MRILITGVGGPTPRSFALALKLYSNYADWEFIATDINPLAVGLYQKQLFKLSYLVPPSGSAGYWERIAEIVDAEGIDYAVILPEKEVEVWSKRADHASLPCPALLPDSRVVDMLVDKSHMTSVLAELGDVPTSVAFGHDLVDLDWPFREIGSSFWVRSAQGTSGLGSLLIDSVDALRNWMQINPKVSRFLASTYLPGRNLACKLLYYEGRFGEGGMCRAGQLHHGQGGPIGNHW
jgi:hypothetical protein